MADNFISYFLGTSKYDSNFSSNVLEIINNNNCVRNAHIYHPFISGINPIGHDLINYLCISGPYDSLRLKFCIYTYYLY
jgi:hypothetical protein